jgi:hypothetical protein
VIISYPYLPERSAAESEQDYEARVFNFIEGHGYYPASHDMCWHGGVHLYAPGTQPVPVRAIADGEVVAYRRANKPVSYKANPDAEDEECDNSFVLLKHETESGDGVKVVYYSLYMHLMNERDRQKAGNLSAIVDAVRSSSGGAVVKPAVKAKVWRKDVLGHAGVMYRKGNTGFNFFHFEVFTTDDGLKAFWHDSQSEIESAGQNGTKELWGANYYIIPAGTDFKDKHPDAGKANPNEANDVNGIKFAVLAAGKTDKKLYVETSDRAGERYTVVWEVQEDGALKQLTPEGGEKHPVAYYEYDLHDRALKLYPDCPSAGYELLRFGRIIGPHTLPAGKQENWQPVTFAEEKVGYVNFSDAKILKLSDADFPHFKGWKKVEESSGAFSDDGICDALLFKKMIDTADADRDGKVTEEEWRGFAQGNGKAQLQRLVCQFPTEWDGANNEKKFGRLKDEGHVFFNMPEPYKYFIDHLKDMQFWSETGLPSKVWHFHPLEFIRHFRKCVWLSKAELVQLLPDYAVRTGTKDKKTTVFWEKIPSTSVSNDNEVLKNHRVPLNKMMRKYGINTRLRQSCFFGNAIQETQWFAKLAEAKGSTLWYAPWYGRGFLQLTNPENYCNYWAWRGRIVSTSLKTALVNAYVAIEKKDPGDRKNTTLQDSNFTALTTEMTGWRTQIEAGSTKPSDEDYLAPADGAGYYWVKNKMGKHADKPHVLERHAVSTESGNKVYYRSQAFWKASAAVNLPGKIHRTDYLGLNGFDSRCCAYGVALAVLCEYKFPDDKAKLTIEFPEGYKPRREK